MAFTAKPIRVGRIPGGGQENVQALTTKAAETFILGAVLTLTAGVLEEAGAAPTTVAGIALQGVDTNPGQDAANTPVEVTGLFVGVSIAVADAVTRFVSDLTDNSDTLVTPTIADVGTDIGLRARADGTWAADKTAANAPIKIVAIDLDNNSVIWVFNSTAFEL